MFANWFKHALPATEVETLNTTTPDIAAKTRSYKSLGMSSSPK